MSSFNFLQRKINTAQKLQSVVKTMKVVSAVGIHQYEQALESLELYQQTIEMGLQIILQENHQQLIVSTPNKLSLGAVIFGSDQGMCSQFNEQIAEYAINNLQELRQIQDVTILAVGSNLSSLLNELTEVKIEKSIPMPSSFSSSNRTVQDILWEIEKWRLEKENGQIILFYNQRDPYSIFKPSKFNLFPLQKQWLKDLQKRPWKSNCLPIYTMDKEQLFWALIGQYFLLWLYQALFSSLASENAMRFAAMQLAQKNIEERISSYRRKFQQERQETITEEILEIIYAL
jgi:F-type H+-transporting ATPase subunit gamma